MNLRLAPFLQVKVSVVNSAGGSFCQNYATDTFYGNYVRDNVCCIYEGFEVVLFVTRMLVDLSVAIKQVTVSAANMWVTIFIIIMHMGAIMQVVFSAVHYAHDCFNCNYADHSFYSYLGDSSTQ